MKMTHKKALTTITADMKYKNHNPFFLGPMSFFIIITTAILGIEYVKIHITCTVTLKCNM